MVETHRRNLLIKLRLFLYICLLRGRGPAAAILLLSPGSGLTMHKRKPEIMPADLLAKVMDAAVFAAQKHQFQRRAGYDKLPYMNHLLKVAEALIRIGEERDEALLLAAILHDVLEDTDATHEILAGRFGREAADIVLELTDDMNLPYMERKWLQVEKAHLLTEKARKIRLVDKATNIRDILTYPLNWPLEKKEAYLENAIQVVGRIRGGNPRLDDWFDQTVEWARERLTELGAAPPK